MTIDEIAEIGIDAENRLYLRPKQTAYPYIYRAAMGVRWDASQLRLYGDAPRDVSHADWFRPFLRYDARPSRDFVRR